MDPAGGKISADEGRRATTPTPSSHAARSVNARIQAGAIWMEIVPSDQLSVGLVDLTLRQRMIAWRRTVGTPRLVATGAIVAAAITAFSLIGGPHHPASPFGIRPPAPSPSSTCCPATTPDSADQSTTPTSPSANSSHPAPSPVHTPTTSKAKSSTSQPTTTATSSSTPPSGSQTAAVTSGDPSGSSSVTSSPPSTVSTSPTLTDSATSTTTSAGP
jgi:hypothetical protein